MICENQGRPCTIFRTINIWSNVVSDTHMYVVYEINFYVLYQYAGDYNVEEELEGTLHVCTIITG